MTVFARDSNLALIFNLARSAAARLISKRVVLQKEANHSPLASTLSTGLAFRFASVAEVNFSSAKQITDSPEALAPR
jgi:hypothetical protein